MYLCQMFCAMPVSICIAEPGFSAFTIAALQFIGLHFCEEYDAQQTVQKPAMTLWLLARLHLQHMKPSSLTVFYMVNK